MMPITRSIHQNIFVSMAAGDEARATLAPVPPLVRLRRQLICISSPRIISLPQGLPTMPHKHTLRKENKLASKTGTQTKTRATLASAMQLPRPKLGGDAKGPPRFGGGPIGDPEN